jgi:hypothetical protein
MILSFERFMESISDFELEDRSALLEFIGKYRPDSERDDEIYSKGLENMSNDGLDTSYGYELKGRIEAFNTAIEEMDAIFGPEGDV